MERLFCGVIKWARYTRTARYRCAPGLLFTVSLLAALFSLHTFFRNGQLAHEGFRRNYRPYVLPNVLMIKALNAPALVTSVKLSFYIRLDNIDALIFQQADVNKTLVYHLDNNQFNLVSDSAREQSTPR
jgi:hypothetical protein